MKVMFLQKEPKPTKQNKTKKTKKQQIKPSLKVSVIVIKILHRFSPNSEDQFHNAFLWQVNYPTGVWFPVETTEQDEGANVLSNATKKSREKSKWMDSKIFQRGKLFSPDIWESHWWLEHECQPKKRLLEHLGVCDILTKRGKLLYKKKGTKVWWNVQLYLVIFGETI